VADVDDAAVTRVVHDFGVEAVAVDRAHTVPCDIYSPCALGGTLNADTIPALACAAVTWMLLPWMSERWAQMTPEEREKFRQRMWQDFGPFGPPPEPKS